MIRPRTREGQNYAYIVSAHSKNHYGIGLGFRSGLHGPLQAQKNRDLSLQPFLRSWDALEEGSCSLRRAKQPLSTAGTAAKAWGSRHPPHPRRQPTTAAGVGARGGQVGHERGAPHLAASAAVVARVAVATAVADGRGSCGSGCGGGSVSSDGCGGGGGDAQSCRLRAAGDGRRAGGARRRRPR